MKNVLTYKNDWENDTYFVDGKQVPTETIKKVKIGKKTLRVIQRNVGVAYNDMGHSYYATSLHLFVEEKVFGMKQEFDLNTICRNVTVVVA